MSSTIVSSDIFRRDIIFMNSINIAACIVAFLLGVVLFTLANEIILKLPNNENIFKGKPKSFEKFSEMSVHTDPWWGVRSAYGVAV